MYTIPNYRTRRVRKMLESKAMKAVTCVILVFVLSLFIFYTCPVTTFPGPWVSHRHNHKGGSVTKRTPWMAPVSRGPCECQPGSTMLKDKFPLDQRDKVSQQRKEEFEKHKERTKTELSKVLLALPNSPLQYPIQGVTVVPLRRSLIPGLALQAEALSSYKVTLKVSKGVLGSDDSDRAVTVTGKGEAELTLTSGSLDRLNAVLATISYTSTIYHVHTADLVSFSFENHQAMFPIVIRQPQLPVLFNMGTDINSQVTITVKTFLRYNNLKVLLSSIRSFYPNMTVIIADDSFEPEKITGDNIQQYFMPPAQKTGFEPYTSEVLNPVLNPEEAAATWTIVGSTIVLPPPPEPWRQFSRSKKIYICSGSCGLSDFRNGWFAGRNLAISQVTTKYFLWADDDFLFTEDTKIEKFVEVMEAHPELDVVGGSVQGNQFDFSLEYDEGDETEGGCLYRKSRGRFTALPGHPQCFLASGVVNFFLARTDSVLKSRFDPLLQRVAHSEWFMDGLGSMMVASCGEVSIQHQQKTNTNLYNKYRTPSGNSDETFKYQLHFFKNNLKCIKFG